MGVNNPFWGFQSRIAYDLGTQCRPGGKSNEATNVTEAEWLICEDPHRMLDFLGSKVSKRKRRLLAVACCRRIWHLLEDEGARRAVETAESFADGLASKKQLSRACAKAWKLAIEVVSAEIEEGSPPLSAGRVGNPANAAAALAAEKVSENVFVHAALAPAQVALANGEFESQEDACAAEYKCQAALIRDLFGNPFRPVQFKPAWLESYDGLIPKLVQAIYQERRFEAMPALAEALRDAGCQDEEILGHCHQRAEHVRGCWLLDELLGKD
jgi:hypothetical protein